MFQDMRGAASGGWLKVREVVLVQQCRGADPDPDSRASVESWHISAVFAAAITLVVAFIVRFMFHSLVVYAPRKPDAAPSRSTSVRRRSRCPGDDAGRTL